MNIMNLLLTGNIGGIEILCKDIHRLSKHKNYFYFIFDGGCIADELEKQGAAVIIPHEKHHAFIDGGLRFIKYCKNHNIDVIICHNGSSICRFYLTLAKLFIKDIKTILYLHSNGESFEAKDKKTLIEKKIIQAAHKTSDVTVAISESVKESYVNLCSFDPQKVKVVYNGTDVSKFYRKNEPHNKFEIIYTGRIIYVKGLDLLIKAISLLPEEVNIHLSVIGSDFEGYTEKMKALAKELEVDDKITFYGFQTDIPKYLSQADLFVHPARWREGFGITLIEAMASQIPCIAFNRGAMPEIIKDGVNGFITDEFSAEGLSEAILKCYNIYTENNNEYEQIRLNALNTAKNFTIEKTVKQLEDLY